jgi:integrase
MDLPASRKRDYLSAVRRVSHLLGQRPATVSINLEELRSALERVDFAAAGLTRKTWANLRSNLVGAIDVSGLRVVLKTARVELSRGWRDLFARVSDQRVLWGLSRFARYCSAQGIPPRSVDDAVLGEFNEAIRSRSLARKVYDFDGRIVKYWNRLTVHPGNGSLATLSIRSVKQGRAKGFLWNSLPENFRADADAYFAWAGCGDPFSPDARIKPMAPLTLRGRRQWILIAARAYVKSGADLASLQSLADLVRPHVVKATLNQLYLDAGCKEKAQNTCVAIALVSIAKQWVRVSSSDLALLRNCYLRLPKRGPGLVNRNNDLLRRFDDAELLGRYLELHQRLWRKALARPAGPRQLADARAAIAIGILTYAPMRLANLTELAFGETLFLPRSNRDETRIEIPPEQTKTREPYGAVLPAKITSMLRTYHDRILQPVLVRKPTYVFDNTSGHPVRKTTMSALILKTLRRHLGIRMTAHQFRHVAAKIFREGGGEWETLRQLLGHTSLATTVNCYAGIDTRRASRKHAALVDEAYERTRAHRSVRRGDVTEPTRASKPRARRRGDS